MRNLGPVSLAWSHLRHKRGDLFGPILVLLVCYVLLYLQVGVLALESQSLPTAPPAAGPADNSAVEGERARGVPRNPLVQGVGTVMVFLLVVLLFRQVAATELASHAREFALLRTLGYTPVYLHAVVLAEMLLLLLLALVPSLPLLPGVDTVIEAWTGWPLVLTLRRLALVLLLTLLLGTVAALLATGKLRAVDPADLF